MSGAADSGNVVGRLAACKFYGGGSDRVCVYSGDGGVDEIEDAGSRYSCPEVLRWGMEMGFPAGRSFT